jgi:hypothetical protein
MVMMPFRKYLRSRKAIQTPVTQGRSTKLISMMKWTRTSRLSIKISRSLSAIEKPHSGLQRGFMKNLAVDNPEALR